MNKTITSAIISLHIIILLSCSPRSGHHAFEQASKNGMLANEGFVRCQNFVNAWLAHTDPETGLVPRNVNESRNIWNAHDSAADNYPFMVLTSAIVDRELFKGRMLDILTTETQLTSRRGALPDVYSFTKNDFEHPNVDINRLMFGASEYIKDGLMPLTEYLGASPWSERMIAILDDMWFYAPVKTEFGNIVSTNVEVNGEMLQVLSRMYWMTADEKYLEWAMRLGDYYLLGDHHPTRDFVELRLRDHGCEIISGLCELYASLHFVDPLKKQEYKPHITDMLTRIMQVGRNKDGLFYNSINPQTGEIINPGIADTFGYTFNGFYSVYLLDAWEQARTDVMFGLSNLHHYKRYDWEHGSADGYADAIEGALNIYNRERTAVPADWLDSEIQIMWGKQQASGIIEGWHGDGNFARTTIMYCLWKTQGLTIQPWRKDVSFGAVSHQNKLFISMSSKDNWQGTIHFDSARHAVNMNLPLDWPRINQFPEWFVINDTTEYTILQSGHKTVKSGLDLLKHGFPVNLKEGASIQMIIE